MNRNDCRTSFLRACALVGAVASASSVAAQETRAELLALQRAAKAQGSQASDAAGPGLLERVFSWGESRLGGAVLPQDGFHPELGGMIPGAGISIGPGYRQHLFGRRAVVDASGAVSWDRSTMMRTHFEWPALFTNRVSVGGEAKYQDFMQVNFFGIGEGSPNTDRTSYRLKDVDVLGFATVRPTSWLSVGSRIGVLRGVTISPGSSSRFPATGDRFDQVIAPALTRQPDFLHGDVSVAADTQDAPGYATSGGRYSMSVAVFQGRTWLVAVNPVVDLTVGDTGELTFRNAAIESRVVTGPSEYWVHWATFDNTTGVARPVGGAQRCAGARCALPANVTPQTEYLRAEIHTAHPAYPTWKTPVHVYLRGGHDRAWTIAGIDRLPDEPSPLQP
jgi:hypothetical protein